MAVVVNNPPSSQTVTPAESQGDGIGLLVGAVVLLLVVALLVVFGLPLLRGASRVPASSGTGASVNVPDHVDVNVRH